MATSAGLYTVSVPISPIIQSRFGWLPSCRGGVLSKFYIHFEKFDLQKCSNKIDRCNAPPNNLDQPNSHRQTHEKTDFLISAWDPGTLWSDFGICVDIVVRCPPIFQVHILKQALVAIHTWLPSC
jgi:hypothetical protein